MGSDRERQLASQPGNQRSCYSRRAVPMNGRAPDDELAVVADRRSDHRPSHHRPSDHRAGTLRLAGAAALSLIGVALTAFAVVMFLGPSAAVPQIDSAGPLLWLDARPPVSLVTALERLGALSGALGTSIGLAAAQRGWRPAPRLLGLLGVIAVTVFAFLPPAGSTD